MTQYLITLCGAMDDLPVTIVSSAAEAAKFCDDYKPFPVDGGGSEQSGPLAAAMKVRGYGPSRIFGYNVIKFVCGVPTDRFMRQWDQDGQWPTSRDLRLMPPEEHKAFLDSLEHNTIS